MSEWTIEDVKRVHETPDADLARSYIKGDKNLASAFLWCVTPQGHEYWERFADMDYVDLPPEAKEYVDAIASIDMP